MDVTDADNMDDQYFQQLLLAQFHHIHTDHSVHHCGGSHIIKDATKYYKIEHCRHGLHAIDHERITIRLEQFEIVIVDMVFTEKCSKNRYHIESAKIEPVKNCSHSTSTTFLHGLHDSTRWLIENEMLHSRILDFGCGLGIESQILIDMGYKVTKYDPFFFPSLEYQRQQYSTVLCSYVLQTISQKEERDWIMRNCILLGKTCFFVVRRDKYHDYSLRLDLSLSLIHETPDFAVYKYSR